jgi:hypothetical protein
MLSHVQNSEAGKNKYEAHVDSLFKVTFIPPAGITNSEVLTEQCKKVTGWKFPGPEHTEQKFMQAKRIQASTEVDNIQEIDTSFELNLNNALQNYVYDIIQEWKKKVFNPFTGERGLKKDFLGKLVIESFAANGDVYWVRTLHNVMPSGNLDSLGQNDYESAEPVVLEVKWIAEFFTEKKY